MNSIATRVLLSTPAFPEPDPSPPWLDHPGWGASWVHYNASGSLPCVALYRLRFSLSDARIQRVHVSADERYELWLDGVCIGRGPERGDGGNWFYDSYDLNLGTGAHVCVARVWALGEQAPHAQMSSGAAGAGFILAPDKLADASWLATGDAAWEVARCDGIEFIPSRAAWGTGARICVRGEDFPWGWELGEAPERAVWKPAVVRARGNDRIAANVPATEPLLRPSQLPDQISTVFTGGLVRHVSAPSGSSWDDVVAGLHAVPVRGVDDLADEHVAWQTLFAGGGRHIPLRTRRRVIVDLETYLCAYPEIITSGGRGAKIRLHWAEALYHEIRTAKGDKGRRDEIEGKFFTLDWVDKTGVGDTFFPDGGERRHFNTLWWECGRFLELLVETADDPLVLDALRLRETRYPLLNESTFDAADARLTKFIPMAFRTLQMCAHETYMDCPYYEQLMYAGDTRIEALVTYVSTRDARLPRKAVELFDASRLPCGLTQSRYPSRVRQLIPPFSLWWIGMVHDYALWRGDLAFVRERLTGVRSVIDAYVRTLGADGLAGPREGWAFVDWVKEWPAGVPTGATTSPSAPINLQLLLALGQVAEMEDWFGEVEFAERARRLADRLARAIDKAFWNEARGLWADDPAQNHYSEHAQSLALLCRRFSKERCGRSLEGLFMSTDLARCSIYFSHYKMEALTLMGICPLSVMGNWWRLSECGFVTTPEEPEPSRSDCHAWGTHPLYHFYASVLGIRPASVGFGSVRIVPQLGDLEWAEGCLVHPGGGTICVRIDQVDSIKRAVITLPEGLCGELELLGEVYGLVPGTQEICIDQ